LILRQRRRRRGSVLGNLVLVTLIRIALVLLILILRLLILRLLLLLRLLILGLLLLLRLLLLLGILLRALRGISGSRVSLRSRSRVDRGTRRGCTLVDWSSSSGIADRREVSILRSVHLIAIVLVAPCRQNSQHQDG
jgi:hypothetical protein